MLQRYQSVAVTHLSTGNTRTKPRAEQHLETVAVSAAENTQEHRVLRRAELKVERTCDGAQTNDSRIGPGLHPVVLESGT